MTDGPRHSARRSSAPVRRATPVTGRYAVPDIDTSDRMHGITTPVTEADFAAMSEKEQAELALDMRDELENDILPRLLDLIFPVDADGNISDLGAVRAHKSWLVLRNLSEHTDEVERFDAEYQRQRMARPAAPATVEAALVRAQGLHRTTRVDTRSWLQRRRHPLPPHDQGSPVTASSQDEEAPHDDHTGFFGFFGHRDADSVDDTDDQDSGDEPDDESGRPRPRTRRPNPSRPLLDRFLDRISIDDSPKEGKS